MNWSPSGKRERTPRALGRTLEESRGQDEKTYDSFSFWIPRGLGTGTPIKLNTQVAVSKELWTIQMGGANLRSLVLNLPYGDRKYWLKPPCPGTVPFSHCKRLHQAATQRVHRLHWR